MNTGRPRSLAFALIIRLAAVALFVIAVQSVLIAWRGAADPLERIEAVLGKDIAILSAHLKPDGSIDLPDALARRYRDYPDDYAYAVFGPDLQIIAPINQHLIHTPPLTDDARLRGWLTSRDELRGPVWSSGRMVRRGDGVYWVAAAMRGDPANLYLSVILGRLAEEIGITILPLLAILLLATVWTVRGSLKPLQRAAAEAAAVNGRTEGARIAETRLPAEVHSLVRAVNGALERMDRSLAFQREFTANVAHELRTPLAILTLQLDKLPDGAEARRLKADVAGMVRLVDQLLKVAQLEALQFKPDGRVDLAGVTRDIIAQLAPLAIRDGKELAFEDRGAGRIQGHPDAMAAALRNLVENALRVSPAGATVTVQAGPGPRIAVTDRGPGIPDEIRGLVFQRFWTADRSGANSGLGLAIVKKTVEAHGGTIAIADSDEAGNGDGGGGATFILSFPPLPDRSPPRPMR